MAMSESPTNTTDRCMVCDDPIPDEYGKWDPKAPVYYDDGAGVYHKGCEDEVFEWSIEAGTDGGNDA